MNYHSKKFGPNEIEVRRCFSKCIKIAISKNLTQMAIALHTKNKLDASTIKNALGEKIIGKILKNGSVKIENVWIYLITERINPTSFIKGPFFCPHISLPFLEKINERSDVTDFIYIPWIEDEYNEYLNKFESTEI